MYILDIITVLFAAIAFSEEKKLYKKYQLPAATLNTSEVLTANSRPCSLCCVSHQNCFGFISNSTGQYCSLHGLLNAEVLNIVTSMNTSSTLTLYEVYLQEPLPSSPFKHLLARG